MNSVAPAKTMASRLTEKFTVDNKDKDIFNKRGNNNTAVMELFAAKGITLTDEAKVGWLKEGEKWEVIDDKKGDVPRRFLVEEVGNNLVMTEEIVITTANKHEYFEKVVWECNKQGCNYKIEQKPNSTVGELNKKTIELANFHMNEHLMETL